MVMVIEDYMYLTVDVRILGILAFVGIFASHFTFPEYILLFLLGGVFYRIVYLFLLIYVPEGEKVEPDVYVDSSKAIGFIPSLATGLAIYAFYRIANSGNHPYMLSSFYDSCNILYAAAFEEPVVLILMLLPFVIIWLFMERKRYRAEKNNQKIIPMLGDGDVYVMAVWLAVIGLADMTMVLFVSCIVQMLAFIYRDKLKNNGGK